MSNKITSKSQVDRYVKIRYNQLMQDWGILVPTKQESADVLTMIYQELDSLVEPTLNKQSNKNGGVKVNRPLQPEG